MCTFQQHAGELREIHYRLIRFSNWRDRAQPHLKTPEKTVHIQCTYSAHTVHIHCTDTVHIKKTRRFRKICQRAIQRTYIVLMFFIARPDSPKSPRFLMVHCMCTVCALSVYCLCTVCALYVHCMCTVVSPRFPLHGESRHADAGVPRTSRVQC